MLGNQVRLAWAVMGKEVSMANAEVKATNDSRRTRMVTDSIFRMMKEFCRDEAARLKT